MSNHWTSYILLGCFVFLVGCSKHESSPDHLLGKWQVSNFMPASLATDSAITIEEAVALSFMDGDLRPATITITKNDLMLHSAGGDSIETQYTLLNVEGNKYDLQTTEGDGVFVIENANKARLNIAGAAYELYR